jgi:hypothetical protein
MEAEGSSESLVAIYQITWRRFSEDCILRLPNLTFAEAKLFSNIWI